jgi:hypothetical protein
VRLIPVQSSNLAGIGYDADTQELYAQFNNGSFYKYKGVEGDVVLGVLFDPDSQGKAFNARVKDGGYVYEKLDTTDVEAMRV